MAQIACIYRYAVKGLSGDLLTTVNLQRDKGLPGDRKFAIAHGDTEFDPDNPQYLPKFRFLMLMSNINLAQLGAHYNLQENTLVLKKADATVFSGNLGDAADIQTLEQFFDRFMQGKTRGAVRLVSAQGHMFADIPDQNVSIINRKSIQDFEQKSGLVIDENRFRGNIYLDDLEAWSEFDLVGKEFRIGSTIFKGAARTGRCAAVNVNLDTAQRDMKMPLALKDAYGHSDMGIYADVLEDGVISQGDKLSLV